MASNTIALSEPVFLELKSIEAALMQSAVSWKPSASRVVELLIHVFKEVHRAVEEARPMKSGPQAAMHYEQALMRALAFVPPTRTRGATARARYATPEERVIVALELKRRLGIEDVSIQLINQFINAGGMQQIDPIRQQVLLKIARSVESSSPMVEKKNEEKPLTAVAPNASSDTPSEAPPAPQSLNQDPDRDPSQQDATT